MLMQDKKIDYAMNAATNVNILKQVFKTPAITKYDGVSASKAI